MKPAVIKVGMADLAAIKSPGILTTLGLGSCVGIALYDKDKKIAGLAHIMLPTSEMVKSERIQNPAKFADTAISELLKKMTKLGAEKKNIVAKIAGGAQMFSFNNKMNDILKIGERNVKSTLEVLKNLDIPLIAQDTGGNYGRTIELSAETGILVVRTIGHGTRII